MGSIEREGTNVVVELTDLKIFVTIAEEESITRAAERLQYVQSNVTTKLRKLERELGVPLFIRHSKGVVLTEKGVVFLQYARNILNLAQEAQQAVGETSYPSGPLAIGVVETVTCGGFIDAIAEFQTMYPEVSLSIVTGNTIELLTKVLDHQLDGALVVGDVHSDDIVSEYTVHDECMLLSQKRYPSARDLIHGKWAVSPEGCPFRAVLEKWLHSEGVPLNNIIEISSLETLLSCVKSGLASTLLPQSVISGVYSSLASYPLPAAYRVINTSLIKRKKRYTSKAFIAFKDLIEARGL
ncbi:DNA-binding transcriptional LysR family regulator [Desmospora activa DSM 45169]|uniref:DNA-binding transcriptional LysR family regulator n=1 Tax=Desmospora activa DSM 45169 TaxID=1121389 RepID=A0A2T4ZBR4_9BACL|nr:DNA-binding transcriptional LysR family regulator [Desmospora activa DSM 45169]